jgi:hypothetical protein
MKLKTKLTLFILDSSISFKLKLNWKSVKQSDHWIMTGWHGEQWDFQNNKRQWNIQITGS